MTHPWYSTLERPLELHDGTSKRYCSDLRDVRQNILPYELYASRMTPNASQLSQLLAGGEQMVYHAPPMTPNASQLSQSTMASQQTLYGSNDEDWDAIGFPVSSSQMMLWSSYDTRKDTVSPTLTRFAHHATLSNGEEVWASPDDTPDDLERHYYEDTIELQDGQIDVVQSQISEDESLPPQIVQSSVQVRNRSERSKGCPYCDTKKTLKRNPDYERHLAVFHPEQVKKEITLSKYFCDYEDNCSRSNKPISRPDHLRDHYRTTHHEDLPKRKGNLYEPCDQESVVSYEWWRCNHCLVRNYVVDGGFECPRCEMSCESERVDVRKQMELQSVMLKNQGSVSFSCDTHDGLSFVDTQRQAELSDCIQEIKQEQEKQVHYLASFSSSREQSSFMNTEIRDSGSHGLGSYDERSPTFSVPHQYNFEYGRPWPGYRQVGQVQQPLQERSETTEQVQHACAHEREWDRSAKQWICRSCPKSSISPELKSDKSQNRFKPYHGLEKSESRAAAPQSQRKSRR
jgi:hypothetical protein